MQASLQSNIPSMSTNRTSPIRKGFRYQDLWALRLCAEWLQQPDRFQWIQFETAPIESFPSRFHLDDLVLCDQENRLWLYQIKHVQNPDEDSWTWDRLLHISGNGASAIQKYYRSFLNSELEGKIGYAAFVTNGRPDDELSASLKTDRVDFDELKKNDVIYKRVLQQLAGQDESRIRSFFDQFVFSFGQKDFTELEAETLSVFFEKLRATQSGVNGLLLRLQAEASKKQTSHIVIENLREWCEFDVPRPLNEAFPIPQDFQLFSKETHDQLIEKLRSPDGGVKVLFGKPGSGKSTYLARLHQSLRKQETPSLLHHYYIKDDPDQLERLQADRVVEALKSFLKQYRTDLGDLANVNSENVQLREFLSTIAKACFNRKTSLVLIVDGLDHVLRYGEATQLKQFLREIACPQPGLWIVLGMQETAASMLPPIFLEKSPRDEWIELKGLQIEAVSRIVSKNMAKLALPRDNDQRGQIVSELFNVSQGNPLHLRYSLQQLRSAKGQITEFDCRQLVSYGGDIEKYYEALWNQIPDVSKTAGYAIAAIDFGFTWGQFREVLTRFESNPTRLSQAIAAIKPLLETKREKIEIYHNSFLLFLRAHADFEEQKQLLLRHIHDWLIASTYEELKWAELAKLSYELGDPLPITSLSYEWVIDAICYPRDPKFIISQLALGAKAAFKMGQLGKAFELSTFQIYFDNALEFTDDLPFHVWESAVRTSDADITRLDPLRLPIPEVCSLAQIAEERGVLSVVIGDAIKALNIQHEAIGFAKEHDRGSMFKDLCRRTVQVVGLDRTTHLRRVLKYIRQFKGDPELTISLFVSYVGSLLSTRQTSKTVELLNQLMPAEKQDVLTICVKSELTRGSTELLPVLRNEQHALSDTLSALYFAINKVPLQSIPLLPPKEKFPDAVSEFDSAERNVWRDLFVNTFLTATVYGYLNLKEPVDVWKTETGDTWILKIIGSLIDAGWECGQNIQVRNPLPYRALFDRISIIPPLRWPDDRKIFTYQQAFRTSLSEIADFIWRMNRWLSPDYALDKDGVAHITSTPYWNKTDFVTFASSVDGSTLNPDCYFEFIIEQQRIWNGQVEVFSERAQHYLRLSRMACLHSDDLRQKMFLRLAGQNLIGYGYHKDMFLHGVLESVTLAHKAGSTQGTDWLVRLAPIVGSVSDYTDGDETRHFRTNLAEAAATVNTTLLRKYYFGTAEEEDLFLAEEIFKSVLDICEFKSEIDIGLGTTAVSDSSFSTLNKLRVFKPGAATALSRIEEYFGPRLKIDKDQNRETPVGKTDQIDVKDLSPSQLLDVLRDPNTTRWDREQLIVKWAKYALDNKLAVQEIWTTVKKLIQEDGMHEMSGELLDLLYPIARQFEPDAGFDFVCWAQANDHGWSRYWTSLEKAHRRFDLVIANHRPRAREFLEQSLVRSGLRYGREGSYSLPIPRVLDFLDRLGDLEDIEEIVESAVHCAELLMADLALPAAKWVNAAECDSLDILIQRLSWPSPLVRERAATALAKLIKEDNACVVGRLLDLIEKEPLESKRAVQLLPIARAATETGRIPIGYIEPTRPSSSIVVENLIKSISMVTGGTSIFTSVAPAEIALESTDRPSEFFSKHIRFFLPPNLYDASSTD